MNDEGEVCVQEVAEGDAVRAHGGVSSEGWVGWGSGQRCMPGMGRNTGICFSWKKSRMSGQHVGEDVLVSSDAHSSLVRCRWSAVVITRCR